MDIADLRAEHRRIRFLTLMILTLFTVAIILMAYLVIELSEYTYPTTRFSLDPYAQGFYSPTLQEDVYMLSDAFFRDERTSTNIDGTLWIPWYSRSNRCDEQTLTRDAACPLDRIDATHHCMVSDEYSQAMILASYGTDEERMRSAIRTLDTSTSSFGTLMSWRIVREGDTITPCDPRTNANCDSASDADARIIIALYSASYNEAFSTALREEARARARIMLEDFVRYTIVEDCIDASNATVCIHLASGPLAAKGGIGAYAFSYPGYYPDALLALLHGCADTGTTCSVAYELARTYLAASGFPHTVFPPGMAFHWENGNAVCDRSCDPIVWDPSDAPRALALCDAYRFSIDIGNPLPLEEYCSTITPYLDLGTRLTPTGTPYPSDQPAYFQNALRALHHRAITEESYRTYLSRAMRYDPRSNTWAGENCYGIYHQAFPIRALASGIRAYEPESVTSR